MIYCELCKNPFKKIAPRHLKDKHQITLDEYKSLFPNAALVSQETLERMANSMKGQKRTEEQKQRLSESHKKSWAENPDQGKAGQTLSEQSKELISMRLKGHSVSETTKQKISENSWNKGKTKDDDPRLQEVSVKIRAINEQKKQGE